MNRAVIFDFDGTIADTFLLAVEIFYHLTGRKEPLPRAEISRLRDLSVLQVARELGVPLWKIPYLGFRGRRLFADKMDTAQIVPGMVEVLNDLKGSGYDLYIVSSNSRANVDAFLKKYRLDQVFVAVYGGTGLGGKSRILRKIIKRGYDPAVTCYVGDETRDIEAAHHAGLRAIAVSWGYNNIKALNRHDPSRIAFDPSEIMHYIATIK